MPVEDFTSKTWTVTRAESDSTIKQGDSVTFSVTNGKVTIVAKRPGEIYTEPADYIEGNKIKMADGHRIGFQIQCKNDLGGGSWTAEDTSGSGDDGD
jgi:hypothetical protein